MKKAIKIINYFNIAMILVLISFTVYIFSNEYIPNANTMSSLNTINPSTNILVETVNTIPSKSLDLVITEYEGYTVDAKLEIPKINLSTLIVRDYSQAALDLSPTKFWGPHPNQIGNYCIVGHNYSNPNMFKHLKNLGIGDTFSLTDNFIGKIDYSIYDVFTTIETDMTVINQDTTLKEVTLITCVNFSNDYRLIIKAREI